MKTLEQQLKAFFQQPYSSSQQFLRNVIFPVFGEEFFESAGNLNVLKKRPELRPKAENSGILEIRNVGQLLVDGSELDIFDITLDSKKQLLRNRVEIQQIIRSIISTLSGAFILFHYQSGARWEWRFTFCHKGAKAEENTDAKRYTFLLGPGQSCRTAAENFVKIHDKIEHEGEFEMADIIRAFDVEALSKEFFGKYKSHYEKFCSYIYNNRYDETKFGRVFAECEEKTIRDYVKKLLGRLVFLQFLQKKGWLGGTSSRWDNGDRDFLQKLYKNATQVQKDDFLDAVLEPLFHRALDTNRAATNQDFDTGVDGFRCCKIPYLNGGLFSKDQGIDDANSDFPAEYFGDLFEFFYQYNFTIDENDPNDAEVGVDPEMLGRIFENLLEDNKDKGAFYTPKAIVQYMCKESLIAYLQNGCKTDRARKAARDFVESHDAEPLRQLHMEKTDGTKLKDSVLEHFDKMLRAVKVCDPAIGSGAFPMGMLRELFECRAALEDYSVSTPADIKKGIIQNNIYGVDIEKGAVDIARLRFWLTLILDEEDPHALPNLDFKIMQGNSLLESFHGVDLSQVVSETTNVRSRLTTRKGKRLQQSLFFFDEAQAMKEIQESVRAYYATDNHSVKRLLLVKIEDAVRSFIQARTEGRPDLQAEAETLPLCNDQFFLWHTFFADVFAKGGFDIVIGNPPYVEAKKLKYIASTLKPLYSVYSGTADLSIYFVEHGMNLLAPKGILSYITTNKFFNTGYGKPLRKLIISNEVNKMINFEQVEVFEGVLVSSVILEMRKVATTKAEFTYEKFYKLNASQFKEQFVSRIGSFGKYPMNELDENEWSFSDVSDLKIKKRIEKGHKLLGNIQGVSINRGVTTGYNPAFIINNDKRDELIATDPKNASIIKNLLQGRNIRKWHYSDSEENLIFTMHGIEIEKYPLVKDHLLKFYSELKPREAGQTEGGRKPGSYEWYEIQDNTAYYKEFEKPEKIIWGLTADKWAYTLDTEGHYLPSNGYILTSTKIPTKYILGLLNSKLLHYYFRFIGVMTAGGAYTLKAATISALPFVDAGDYEPIINLVDQILSAKKHDPKVDVSVLEAEIDRLVYQLYGLTDDEINIVEGTLK